MRAKHGTVTHWRQDAHTENVIMKLHTLTFHLSLLIVAAPAWGQSPPQPAGNEVRRPLNLSLPRDVLSKSSGIVITESQDTAERNLQPAERQKETRSERQPYGTGYEARQRGMTSGGNSGFGGGGSGTGAGSGGRGGMGRGR